MIGIIQDWLFSQLGVYFNFDKLDTNNNFQNGFVFLDIFIRYGLLNSNFAECFTKDCDIETRTKNMRLLKPIFDMLSVSVDEDVIFNVVTNSKDTIIKLLYELYVCLENKQQLYFITQKEFENIQNKHIKCLNKRNIFVSQTKTETVVTDPDICFKKPLMNNIDLIEWYKNKYKLIEQNMKVRLSKLKKSLHSEQLETIHNASYQKQHNCPCSCKSDNISEELVSSLPDMDMFNKADNNANLLNYNQFMTLYKAKQQQRSSKQSFEKNIQSELLQQTWDTIMDKQNEIYNTLFSQIMLKQSKYEKQILEKLFQTQSQIKIESENKISVSNKIIEEDIRQINCDFKIKEEFEEFERQFSDEQARIFELHRKLYKQKQDLIKEKHYNLCSDVLDSLLDIAVSASEYQSIYGVPVPNVLWNSWKQFYYKSQSIHIPFQSLERDISAGEIINYDNIVGFEKESSAVVNANDVDEYLYTCGKWFFENICKEFGDINENNLAFIIYRLLSLKYPSPPSPLPAQLPFFRVAAVLLNFHDIDSIERLRVLLSKPCIHVFDCDTAIKKSIHKFEEETKVNEGGKADKKPKEVKASKVANKRKGGSTTSKNDKKENKSGKKKKNELETDSSKDKNLADDIKDGKLFNLINKETQTSFKEDQLIDNFIERSDLGLIGEKVFNTLKDGQKVDDALIVDVIIEYLKTINEFDGWVLLNYPTTIGQALAIELALSGKKLPVDDYTIHNEQFEYQDTKSEIDENAPKRKSKLLMSPNDENNQSFFKTYFTTVIKYKHSSETDEHILNKDNSGDNMIHNQEHTEPSNSDTIVLDVLERVYNDQSVYTNFYYESCSIDELKKLARVILKEDGLNKTASVDLFGKETLDRLSKVNKKHKKDSSSGKNKLLEKSKNKKKQMENIDPVETENKDLSPENNTFELHKSSLDSGKVENTPKESIQLKLVKPGDEDWHFVSLPLSEEMAVILATMWENLEHCYLQNLEDIFFENRMINLRLVPYSTYIKETVDKVYKKPDLRQELVNLFQNYFMGLVKDLRGLSDVKNHLFCKVLELQQNLWQIIDNKKNEVEAKRQELIIENWLLNELCMLINNYLSLVQTELNRSTDTLTIISDYYLNMLGKTSPTSNNTHLINSKVNKVTPDDLMNNNSEILTNNKDSDKQKSSFPEKFTSQVDTINIISQSLINCQESEEVVNFIQSFIPREVARISHVFQSMTLTYFSQIKTEEDLLLAAQKKLGKQKDFAGTQLSKENKKLKDKKNVEKNLENPQKEHFFQKSGSTEHDSELNRLQKESLLAEWKFVTASEIDRFKLRMDLISSRAEEDIIEFYCYLESVFCELLSSNLSEYETDINNTNKLCDYLRTAIEEESSLVYPMVLKRSNFFLNISQNLREGYTEIKELIEEPHDCVFSINQLKKLLYVFKIAGPHGVIRKQPFCYILQDLMLFNDTDNQPHLPKAWNLLNEPQLIRVLDIIFGLEYAINWRDFLIYNFSIPFPSCDEILFMRNQFMAYDTKNTEVITLTEYNNCKLWFEHDLPKDPQEGLRCALIKGLLSEMFQVDAQKINYTALLLYLCKDYDPMVGFKKALCLSMGKLVVTSKEELDTILKEEFEIKKTVIGLLDNIINTIIFYKEGTLIYEIFESTSAVSEGEVESNYSVSDGTGSRDDSLQSSQKVVNETSDSENDSQNHMKCSPESLSSLNSLHLTKTWVSKIPTAAVVSILNASFLHQDKTFSLRNLYLNGLEEESDENGMIEAHTLVRLAFMDKLFKLTNKFKICIPSEVVKVCLKQKHLSIYY